MIERVTSPTILVMRIAWAAGGCLPSRSNPVDQSRCSPACSTSERCYQGGCVALHVGSEGGPADWGPAVADSELGLGDLRYLPLCDPCGQRCLATCGDGRCDPDESCRSCPSDCTCGSGCGNGIVEPGEGCDDGNQRDDDFCSNRCAPQQVLVSAVAEQVPHNGTATVALLEGGELLVGWSHSVEAGGRVQLRRLSASGGAIDDAPLTLDPIVTPEAEWEVAYRAGTNGALYQGALGSCAGADAAAGAIAWYGSNSDGVPHPRGAKTPNGAGFYDMAGNVAEWTNDRLSANLGAFGVSDPCGSSDGVLRVMRGGSYASEPAELRAAFRTGMDPATRSAEVGFRCGRSAARWHLATPMGTARRGASITVLKDGRVLVAAGQDDKNASLASAEIYDPANGGWTATGSMNQARHQAPALLLSDGRVMVAGGYVLNGGTVADTEIYDPASNSWSAVGKLAVSRYGHALLPLPGGRVMAAGGYDAWGGEDLTGVEIFDPGTQQWSADTPLPKTHRAPVWAVFAGGRILLAGGTDAKGVAQRASWVYDPSNPGWVATGDLNGACGVDLEGISGTVLLPDGRILAYAAAGEAGCGDRAEIFDPSANQWTATSLLAAKHRGNQPVLLPDGQVVLAGGDDLAAVERYNWETGRWQSIAPLTQGRYNGNAVTLNDGTAFSCGGVGGSAASLASCERLW